MTNIVEPNASTQSRFPDQMAFAQVRDKQGKYASGGGGGGSGAAKPATTQKERVDFIKNSKVGDKVTIHINGQKEHGKSDGSNVDLNSPRQSYIRVLHGGKSTKYSPSDRTSWSISSGWN